ncbi:unnamed protein product, partial [Musa acuminata subsp. burmannicoides]
PSHPGRRRRRRRLNGGQDLLDDFVAECRNLGVQRLDGLLLLPLQVLKRLRQLRLHTLPPLRQLLLQLRRRLLLHLVQRRRDLRPRRLHHRRRLIIQLLHLPRRVLHVGQLRADGGVPLVHELAQGREVDLVQRHHQQQELDGDRGQSQVEVEERRLLYLLSQGRQRRGGHHRSGGGGGDRSRPRREDQAFKEAGGKARFAAVLVSGSGDNGDGGQPDRARGGDSREELLGGGGEGRGRGHDGARHGLLVAR